MRLYRYFRSSKFTIRKGTIRALRKSNNRAPQQVFGNVTKSALGQKRT
jgi:hypothetical protein